MAGKRLGLDSKFQLKKCNERSKGDNDRISRLPDDILVTVLSWLPMKEAARTSVLSSRWMNLWKHTSSLDFRAEKSLAKIAENYELWSEERQKYYEICSEERRKYITWVNRILRSHKAVTLKEFRICFDLDLSSSEPITRWLEFAFMRHVQKLELDLSLKFNRAFLPTHYTLPHEFLTRSIGESSGIDFKPLKELSLKFVNLTAEAIENLLRMCPLLEKLVVQGTDQISNLEVCGPSLALKHLQWEFCKHLKSVRVSAPNLITLVGPMVEVLLLENVPMLKEISVNCTYCHDSVEKLLPTLSCCISQLEILTLQLFAHRKEIEPVFPELPTLKKLVVEYCTHGDKSLMGLTPMITTSPNLQEFVLKLMLFQPSRLRRKVKNIVQMAHQHLKVFRFYGYYGRSSDVELVRYILGNSAMLEKLIIDPFNPVFSDKLILPEDLENLQTARDYAKKQLEARVPQNVELVIH